MAFERPPLGIAVACAKAALTLCVAVTISAATLAQGALHPADAVNARPAQGMGYDGRGTTVVVIDSGGFATDSPGLQAKLVGEACFSTDPGPSICPNGQGSQSGPGSAYMQWPYSYHGTEIAEYIANSSAAAYGVAPATTIFVIRPGGPNGKAGPLSSRDALGYVYFTLRSQFNIVAIVTGSAPDGTESSANLCTDAAYRGVVAALKAAGIASLSAAGNSGYHNAIEFDGCRTEAFALSAFAQGDTLSPISNFSVNSTFGAVAGPNLLSTAGDGTVHTIPDAATSWAKGLTAGAIAILKTYRPGASVDAVVAALQAGGLPITVNDTTPGSPLPHYQIRRIDVSNAVNYLTSDYVPESGFWWNRGEGGRGYFIELQGNALFVGAFMYNASGQAEWYVGRLAATGPAAYAGSLALYGGGQAFGSARYAAPSALGSAANIQLQFSSAGTGALQIQTGGGSIAIPIERFRGFDDGHLGNAQRPPTGWYWDPARPGTGVAIDCLGDSLFMVAYAYDPSGHAEWTALQAASPSNQFIASTQPLLYANGQTLVGPYQPPSAPSQPFGTMTIQPTTPHVLTVIQSNGLRVDYQRYHFLDQ